MNGAATQIEREADPDARTVEGLHAAYLAQPGSFRDVAQVFRASEEKPQNPGGWVLDVPCAKLNDARLIVAKDKNGGRGIYQVVLMDSVSGRRARVGFLRVESDLREATPQTVPSGGGEAVAVLRDALARAEQRAADLESRLTTSPAKPAIDLEALIERYETKLDDARDRARKAFDDGHESGFKRGVSLGIEQGKIDGRLEAMKKSRKDDDKDSADWRPEQVRGILSEVRQFFSPGEDRKTAYDPPILNVIKQALGLGLSVRQTVDMFRTLRGEDAFRSIASYVTGLGARVLEDPEVQEFLTANIGNREWFEGLLAELASVVAKTDGNGG